MYIQGTSLIAVKYIYLSSPKFNNFTKRTSLQHISQYPYILFLWAFVGVALKFMWTGFTGMLESNLNKLPGWLFSFLRISKLSSTFINRLLTHLPSTDFQTFFCIVLLDVFLIKITDIKPSIPLANGPPLYDFGSRFDQD